MTPFIKLTPNNIDDFMNVAYITYQQIDPTNDYIKETINLKFMDGCGPFIDFNSKAQIVGIELLSLDQHFLASAQSWANARNLQWPTQTDFDNAMTSGSIQICNDTTCEHTFPHPMGAMHG